MNTHSLDMETRFSQSIEQIYDFFSRADNLEKVTPPSLRFQILTPLPIQMGKGTIIDYRLKLYGIPLKWKTEIILWEPPYRFVDKQIKGPYKLWVHEHRFVEDGSGTIMRDHVDYAVPGGLLEPLIYRLYVKKDVQKIFDYRTDAFARIFDS